MADDTKNKNKMTPAERKAQMLLKLKKQVGEAPVDTPAPNATATPAVQQFADRTEPETSSAPSKVPEPEGAAVVSLSDAKKAAGKKVSSDSKTLESPRHEESAKGGKALVPSAEEVMGSLDEALTGKHGDKQSEAGAPSKAAESKPKEMADPTADELVSAFAGADESEEVSKPRTSGYESVSLSDPDVNVDEKADPGKTIDMSAPTREVKVVVPDTAVKTLDDEEVISTPPSSDEDVRQTVPQPKKPFNVPKPRPPPLPVEKAAEKKVDVPKVSDSGKAEAPAKAEETAKPEKAEVKATEETKKEETAPVAAAGPTATEQSGAWETVKACLPYGIVGSVISGVGLYIASSMGSMQTSKDYLYYGGVAVVNVVGQVLVGLWMHSDSKKENQGQKG